MTTTTPIPVHILTGFLGAGKTSLLNALVRAPELAGTAVLINEFGEVAIDHDLIAEIEDGVVITTTGCLCCTAESDVVAALATLEAKTAWGGARASMPGALGRAPARYSRVIVETTGLADPAPVVNALLKMPSEPGRPAYQLASVVTLFDIVNGDATLDEHLEAVKQAALADVLMLTKTDLALDPATKRDIETSRRRLAAINPSAIVMDRAVDTPRLIAHLAAPRRYDRAGLGGDALAWLAAEAVLGHAHAGGAGAPLDRNRHDDRVQAHVLTLDDPLDPKKFQLFLSMLPLSAGPKILRLKGLFALSDDPGRPVVVHGVQHVISPVERLAAWPSADHRTRLVIISRDLKVPIIERMLRSLQEPRPVP